jgi:hypothetical protein
MLLLSAALMLAGDAQANGPGDVVTPFVVNVRPRPFLFDGLIALNRAPFIVSFATASFRFIRSTLPLTAPS